MMVHMTTTSTPTRATLKGHGLKVGDEFTYFGRNTTAPDAEGVRYRVVPNRGSGVVAFVQVDDESVKVRVGSATKIWATCILLHSGSHKAERHHTKGVQTMAQKTTHRPHPGPCTTSTLCTADSVRDKLIQMGYRFSTTSYEWEMAGAVGGRLEWVPDYCNPNAFDVGTKFWLRSHTGTVTPVELP